MCSTIENQQCTYGSNQLVKPKMGDSQLYNILILSFSFFLIFTAFNTSSGIQKVVVESINKQTNVGWDAYISSCIIYFCFSFSNFFVPSILSVISTKTCMFLSEVCYLLFSLSFFYPFKYELIIASIILGISAGSLWVAQGQFLAYNSNSETIDRNTGIFWAIFQGSMIFGNLYCFYQFEGVIEIEPEIRIQTFTVLSIICLLGCIVCLFLKQSKSILHTSDSTAVSRTNPISALKRCFGLFKSKKMIFISIASFYTGLEQSFYGAVYATAVGYTQAFGDDSKKFIGLYGVSNGLGSIFGALIFGWLAKKFIKDNRAGVFGLGFLGHLIAFALAFINHPNRSPIEETSDFGLIVPRVWISLFVGFLLCTGDACFNTQIIGSISTIYRDGDDPSDTSSAFALCKFFHCAGASLTFFYSSFDLLLTTHLIILLIFGFIGSTSFYLVERLVKIDKK